MNIWMQKTNEPVLFILSEITRGICNRAFMRGCNSLHPFLRHALKTLTKVEQWHGVQSALSSFQMGRRHFCPSLFSQFRAHLSLQTLESHAWDPCGNSFLQDQGARNSDFFPCNQISLGCLLLPWGHIGLQGIFINRCLHLNDQWSVVNI